MARSSSKQIIKRIKQPKLTDYLITGAPKIVQEPLVLKESATSEICVTAHPMHFRQLQQSSLYNAGTLKQYFH